jgi:uncharacterized protein
VTPLKILFTGMVGAGKTTAIGALSEVAPIRTEAQNTDTSVNKENTTVAMDYGEFTLGDGTKVMLYGTPGQGRFDFMWSILGQGALGVIVLINNAAANPLEDFKVYLNAFDEFAARGAMVVGVGRTENGVGPTLDSYYAVLAEQGRIAPVFSADVRRSEHVLMLVDALISQLELQEEISP